MLMYVSLTHTTINQPIQFQFHVYMYPNQTNKYANADKLIKYKRKKVNENEICFVSNRKCMFDEDEAEDG